MWHIDTRQVDTWQPIRGTYYEAIEQINSSMAEHVNAHRLDVQFHIWDLFLLST
jgi:hypothetical protein